MSEEYLIRHCAPTLAGIKTGNLFTCPYQDRQEVIVSLRAINRKLRLKGLRAVPLRFSQSRALIYLYRPGKLRSDLSQTQAADILKARGYTPCQSERCVAQLRNKLRQQEDFPHEIGLFLGYPPEDVQGFLEDKPCKCVGCWKVYGDTCAAQKKFAQYRKCTRIYGDCWAKGSNIERLTVAG